MQRLYLDDNEKITRKEYLKRKKKQAKQILKKRSKITYFMIVFIAILSIYVFVQLYIYNKYNNYIYIEDEGMSQQNIYNVFYVTEGYTYDPVYSLNKVQTNGFNDQVVLDSCGLSSIQVDNEYIYGIKGSSICRINKLTNEVQTVIESGVNKYKIYNGYIYYIFGDNDTLALYNTNDNTRRDTDINNVSELLIDENYIFIVKDEKTKKVLLRYNRDINDKKDICVDANVSYIVQDNNSIYFVNKKDSNKIYVVNKDGGASSKVLDICSMSDKGQIKEIDGSKYMFIDNNKLYYVNVEDNNALWSVDLNTKENVKIISVPVEILQNIDSTVFYKIKNERGVYLYNYDTKFMSQVSTRKIKEFFVDTMYKLDENVNNTKELNRN